MSNEGGQAEGGPIDEKLELRILGNFCGRDLPEEGEHQLARSRFLREQSGLAHESAVGRVSRPLGNQWLPSENLSASNGMDTISPDDHIGM